MFVAVHRAGLPLDYVDELLQLARNNFEYIYDPDRLEFPEFDATFAKVLAASERQAAPARAPGNGAAAAVASPPTSSSGEEDGDGAGGGGDAAGGPEGPRQAFDAAKIEALQKKKNLKGAASPGKKGAASPGKRERPSRWNKKEKPEDLDFSGGAGEGGAPRIERLDLTDASRMDEEEDAVDYALTEEDAKGRPGWFGAMVRTVGVNVAGAAALRAADLEPALETLRKKLMAKNVAEEVASEICANIEGSLVGRQLGSFTRISTAVLQAMEEALTKILTPGRVINVLQEVQAAQRQGRPYTVVFVGVNGVGKSTNLAKIAYWLTQHGKAVLIAACDTFRSGAVEQLRTHCARLGAELFERGYEKDPAGVAREAIKEARHQGKDVVLVDTAGRMQDNEPLMRALAKLVAVNEPDLVLFVGEALVGNDGVDQLTKFNQRLQDLGGRGVDGIVLTKVGADGGDRRAAAPSPPVPRPRVLTPPPAPPSSTPSTTRSARLCPWCTSRAPPSASSAAARPTPTCASSPPGASSTRC